MSESGLSLAVPPELVEATAQRAAELVLERLAADDVAASQRDSKYLTVAELAEQVGLSRKAISRAIARGELPASKVCGRLRVRSEDAEAWLDGNRVEPREPTVAPAARPSAKRRQSSPTSRRGPAAEGLRTLLREEEGRQNP